MKSVLAILFILICNQSIAQNKKPIIIGNADTLHSVILNEKREMLVYVPKSWDGISRKTLYPVMYVLDGHSFFHSVTGIVQYLSSEGKMPEMIVVSISNTDRTRDFTPSHSIKWSDGEVDTDGLGKSGGGNKFTSFVQKELIPRIDSLYPTAPYRMYVGHSFGGLSVINSLLHHPHLFNSYVAIDPGIWWDDKLMIRQAEDILAKENYTGKRLFFATANTMNKGMDTTRVLSDTVHGNHHVRMKFQFRDLLARNKKNNLVWDWKYYNDDNHGSVPLIAHYDAFRSIFKDFALSKELSDPTIDINDIKNHYRRVSAMMGYEILAPTATINRLGYTFLESKQYDKSYQFFKLNIENDPGDYNLHDSLGDYYTAIGNKKKAIEAITKALSLKDYPAGRRKLKDLEAMK